MAHFCCSEVAKALGELVYHSNTTAYNAVLTSYWSTQEASLTPTCIVSPRTSMDVATFISTISGITNCDFAIKSQGHAPAAGAANIANGITLDLSGLNSTTISHDHSIASIEAGSAWVDVYRTLDSYGKTVAGGRNGAVGVGGLTLGGGISYYSPQVGFTCDTVSNFEVVLSCGEIANANATSNPALYRALKGGSNNFGVVTRIDFRTIDSVPLRAGHLFLEPQYVDQVLTAFVGIASADEYDVHASIVLSLSFNVTTRSWSIVSVPIYTLPELNPPVYAELFALPNITALSTASIENISTLAAEPPYPLKYQAFRTSTYASSAELLLKLFDVANQTLALATFPSDVSFSLTFEPLPIALVKHGVGTNSLGTSPQDGNAIVLLLSTTWTNFASSDDARRVGQGLVHAMDRFAHEMGGLHDFRYLNYADPSQDPLGSYGEEDLVFLKEVSRKYDPRGMFQKRVSGGFKLSP